MQSANDLDLLLQASEHRPQLIFKHSTRCSISFGVKNRLDDRLQPLGEKFGLHYLDLLSHRDISNRIADRLQVWHESPQVIVIDKGKVVYHQNHGMISPERLLAVN
jgi:bacillithiol system protein YtxJ